MVIYGLALLSACFFGGMLLGDILGMITGVGSNVGGVGFAMLALILVSSKLLKENKLSTMYIPIVVAMTACQDVAAAIMGGGLLTIMCGIVCTIVPLLLIPVISKLGAPSEPLPPLNKE